MKETIYISNFRSDIDKVSDYISTLKSQSRFSFSYIQEKNDVLKILLNSTAFLNPDVIRALKITCIVQNELFRTVYLEGKRVMWSSRHN